MSSPTPAIEIENLRYSYGRAEAVHDLQRHINRLKTDLLAYRQQVT